MENWFLAYTKPKYEDMVATRLEGAGFSVLNPKLKERKLYRRKVTDVISPLFPCYLFVKFDSFRDYHLIRYTRGIKRLLSGDNGPAVVPQGIIDSIVSKMECGFIPLKQTFVPGEDVIVRSGPFEGFNAIFEKEMKGAERVSVLLRAINVRLVIDGCLIARC